MKDALTSGMTTVANFVPKLVIFLVILFIGFFVAKTIGKALSVLLTGSASTTPSSVVGSRRRWTTPNSTPATSSASWSTTRSCSSSCSWRSACSGQPHQHAADPDHHVPAQADRRHHHHRGRLGDRRRSQDPDRGHPRRAVLRQGPGQCRLDFILFLGVIAALNQIGVATTVTTPILITILATIAGVIVSASAAA